MKNLIAVLLVASLVGCGSDEVVTQEVVKEVKVLKAQDFEGLFFCNNNSMVELVADFDDRVSFDTSNQSLNSVNPKNQTLGTHPVIGERDVLIQGNRLAINPRNYTYSSSTHDIEQDISGSNITGSRRTDVKVELITEDHVRIIIEIFSGAVNSNINGVIAKRVLNCRK